MPGAEQKTLNKPIDGIHYTAYPIRIHICFAPVSGQKKERISQINLTPTPGLNPKKSNAV